INKLLPETADFRFFYILCFNPLFRSFVIIVFVLLLSLLSRLSFQIKSSKILLSCFLLFLGVFLKIFLLLSFSDIFFFFLCPSLGGSLNFFRDSGSSLSLSSWLSS